MYELGNVRVCLQDKVLSINIIVFAELYWLSKQQKLLGFQRVYASTVRRYITTLFSVPVSCAVSVGTLDESILVAFYQHSHSKTPALLWNMSVARLIGFGE